MNLEYSLMRPPMFRNVLSVIEQLYTYKYNIYLKIYSFFIYLLIIADSYLILT